MVLAYELKRYIDALSLRDEIRKDPVLEKAERSKEIAEEIRTFKIWSSKYRDQVIRVSESGNLEDLENEQDNFLRFESALINTYNNTINTRLRSDTSKAIRKDIKKLIDIVKGANKILRKRIEGLTLKRQSSLLKNNYVIKSVHEVSNEDAKEDINNELNSYVEQVFYQNDGKLLKNSKIASTSLPNPIFNQIPSLELSHREIALLYYYAGFTINSNNKQAVATKHGKQSGDKLSTYVTDMKLATNRRNRMGAEAALKAVRAIILEHNLDGLEDIHNDLSHAKLKQK